MGIEGRDFDEGRDERDEEALAVACLGLGRGATPSVGDVSCPFFTPAFCFLDGDGPGSARGSGDSAINTLDICLEIVGLPCPGCTVFRVG